MPKPRRRFSLSTLGLLAVSVVAGLLFSSNARIFAASADQRPQNVIDLINEETDRVDDLEAALADLRSERDDLLEQSDVTIPQIPEDLAISAAMTPVTGDGIQVRMWDAPVLQPDNTTFDVNDLVVHQQDIEGVLNALWAGGAEALTIQGQRITSLSAVRCIGNVLFLHGRQYSPPYVIQVIGDQDDLRQALDDSPTVDIYLQYVDAVGLGWEVTNLTDVTFPAAAEPGSFTYAQEIQE